MAYYEIGAFLRRMRVQKGLSQKELAEGITEHFTLSRIETGRQLPNKNTLDALMARLGLNAERYFSTFLSARDYETFELRNKLSDCIRLHDFNQAKDVVAQLNAHPDFQDGLNRQFLLHAMATIEISAGGEPAAIRKRLLDAIHISIPGFRKAAIHAYLLTTVEIKIINTIAVTYGKGRIQDAVRVLYALKQSMDASYINRRELAQTYPMVLYNLSKYLGLSGRLEEAIAVCEEAEAICVENDNLLHLPKILFNKAYCLHQKGDTEHCARLVHRAYWCCDMIGKIEDRDSISEHAKNTMGIIIHPIE